MLKNKTALSLSPLALLTLAACGGTKTAATKSVVAEKGPLNLATAFLDYNDDGIWQELLEPGGLTGATGAATFSTALQPTAAQTTAGYDLKILGSANTMDMSSNTVFTDSLSAPSSSSMITPVTTIMAESDLTAAQVVATLGLPTGMNPLTFSSFDTTLTDAEKLTALKVEKASQKVMSIVSTFATAAESSGATAAVAFKAAMDSVVNVVKDATTAYEAAAAGSKVTLSFSAAQVDAVKAKMDVEVAANLTALQKAVFDVQITNNVTALKNVVAKIEAIDITDAANLDLSASKDIFALTASLVDQVQTATAAVKTAQDGGNALVVQAVAFTSDAAITASIANPGPTDMALSSATISEDAATLVVGTVTTTDTSDTGTAAVAAVGSTPAVAAVAATVETGHTYSIVTVAGTDGAKFSINASTGVLTLLEQPDYETKSSYTVAIKTTEAGANPKSYIETFTIAVTDVVESGVFGIASDTVTWTDYNPAASADIGNKVMTSTDGSTVTMGTGAIRVNLANLVDMHDGAPNNNKSPMLNFMLDSVPAFWETGDATIKATIIDGADGTRDSGENEISITVNVSYSGGTLTAPAGNATGSYTKADGTSVAFTVANGDVDAFSMTAANLVTGAPASLNVKTQALYDAFIAGAGSADLLVAGKYSIALETTLPLQNTANEAVTKFTGTIELTTATANTIYGTDGADTIAGGATGEVIVAGAGKDTIATGLGSDYVVLVAGFGSTTLANSNTVSDFANDTDKFALDGLTVAAAFAELTVAADETTAADTVISKGTEYLMTVTNVAVADIDINDFVLISDIA